jgi:hypothetical protein
MQLKTIRNREPRQYNLFEGDSDSSLPSDYSGGGVGNVMEGRIGLSYGVTRNQRDVFDE